MSELETAPQSTEATESAEDSRNRRKIREGQVVSVKMNKTIIVTVVERTRHGRYSKTIQQTQRLYVHDEVNDAKVGDKVRVMETRPLSKLKRWRLVEVVERAR
jgi:small subunit ribosomal protein S17